MKSAASSWNDAAAYDWGRESVIGNALVDRARDLAVGRDEDVRLAAEHGDDVVLADADAAVGAVEHELDLRLGS